MPDVLVFDQNFYSEKAIIPRLESWAYRIQVADALQQAINILSIHACPIVVLAVYEDDLDISDVIASLYQTKSDVKIIAVGNRSSLELERAVRLAKVFYYMVQPVDLNELQAVIHRANGEVKK